ncbi:hypothetical protein D3C86_1617210 [compost metagenome]
MVTTSVTTLFHLFFNAHSKIPEIHCVNFCSPASNFSKIRPKKVALLICDNFPKREYNQGTTVKDTNNDIKVANMTVTQNWRRISDTKPDDSAIGKNTTTITNVIAVTVKPISAAPSYAARILLLPICM